MTFRKRKTMYLSYGMDMDCANCTNPKCPQIEWTEECPMFENAEVDEEELQNLYYRAVRGII